MKLHIVYFRTMENSPEVEIRCVTASETKAQEAFKKAREEEKEWMEDTDEDSGDWAEACIKSFEIPGDRMPGETVYVFIKTVWHECIETEIKPYLCDESAIRRVNRERKVLLEEYPGLKPFYEDESIENATYLEDPDVAVDVYFSIETIVIK